MTHKLGNLNVEEMSGVDKAANLYEGWVVMKSKEGGVLADEFNALLEKADVVVAQVDAVQKALDGEKGLFVNAPENVQKAVTTVREYLNEQIAPETDETRKNAEKPGFMGRVMAALIGTSTEKEAPQESEAADWDTLCKQIAEGPKKEEASV